VLFLLQLAGATAVAVAVGVAVGSVPLGAAAAALLAGVLAYRETKLRGRQGG
jgi:hypothetical protein